MLVRTVAGFGVTGFMTMFTPPVVFAQDDPVVIMDTSHGTITIELDSENAPISVDNFLTYDDAGHYDLSLIHN